MNLEKCLGVGGCFIYFETQRVVPYNMIIAKGYVPLLPLEL